MSLSSYNGENSFTIKGKKFIKRGANNIYDIASVAGTSGNFSTGWINQDASGTDVANGAKMQFDHNLGTTDLVYNVYAAKDNSGTDAIDISNHEISQTDAPRADYGSQALITSNTIQVVLGSQGLLIPNIGATYNVSNSNFTTYPYIKVVASAGGSGSGSGNIVATMRAKGPEATGLGASTAYTQICSDPKNFPFMGRSDISSYYSYSFATFKNNTSSYAILQMTMSSAWVPSDYYKVSLNSINSSYGGNQPQLLGSAVDNSNIDRLYFCLVEPQAGFGLMITSDSNAKGNQYSSIYSEASILSDLGGYTADELFTNHADLTNIWTDIGAPTNSQIYIADVYG